MSISIEWAPANLSALGRGLIGLDNWQSIVRPQAGSVIAPPPARRLALEPAHGHQSDAQ